MVHQYTGVGVFTGRLYVINPGNNDLLVCTKVVIGLDNALTIFKQTSKSTVEIGESSMFTLTLTNGNAQAMTSVSVTDTLPSGFVYQT